MALAVAADALATCAFASAFNTSSLDAPPRLFEVVRLDAKLEDASYVT
jgi:hypothetical protein